MISSPSNDRFKALRRLAQAKGKPVDKRGASFLSRDHLDRSPSASADQKITVDQVSRSGSTTVDQEVESASANFLFIEGPNLLEAALDAGLRVHSTYATENFLRDRHRVLDRLPEPATPVSEPLLDSLADADSPRGLVAVVDAPKIDLDLCINRLDDARSCALYLDRVRDPGNVGALVRVAEAAGAAFVLSSENSVSWRHPRALRASAGSSLRLPVIEAVSIDRVTMALEHLNRPVTWVALRTGGEDLYATTLEGPMILALGSESSGLSEEIRRHCARSLAIPMAGRVESLNVATAGAVTLFELRRRWSMGSGQ